MQIDQRFENMLPNAMGGEANASTLGLPGAYSGERVEWEVGSGCTPQNLSSDYTLEHLHVYYSL